MARLRKALIPAGGFGTRLLPATKAVPKELLPIVDKPLVQFIVEELVASGFEELVLVTGRQKGSIEDHFDSLPELEGFLESKGKLDLLETMKGLSNMIRIVSVRQPSPLGLGHAVLCAKTIINNEPFAVLLPDDLIVARKPCIGQLADVFNEFGDPVVAIQRVPMSDVKQYGIIKPRTVRDRLYQVVDMIEKPTEERAYSDLAIIGRYVLPPEIFTALEETPPGAGGEIQLTDAIRSMLGKRSVLGLEYEGRRFDAGNKPGFVKANVFVGLSHPEVRDELLSYIRELDLARDLA
ncbi:MAG TPA: UTP--glucose-1-phosphate uridylyltransferase GalU [Syntrophorhabdales bacterium]|nr:UTP--glucose-1-phosphate uridylyltransferase GalU [Syntrophorhabdales bacterium]